TVIEVIQIEARNLVGQRAAEQVRIVLENVSRPGQGGPVTAIVGIVAFLFGATAAFTQLQGALNAAWQVGPDPRRGNVVNFLLRRALSFAMIFVIGLLVAASLVLSTVLEALGGALDLLAPASMSVSILRLLDTLGSFVVLSTVFTGMFRFLPDA